MFIALPIATQGFVLTVALDFHLTNNALLVQLCLDEMAGLMPVTACDRN